MKYRKLSSAGDYVFGQGSSEILVDSPQTVAQAVTTRLQLDQGEWFLDADEGTPYKTEVLGTGTTLLYDAAIQKRILGTPGVVEITDYYSQKDSKRHLTVNCTITTQYGSTTISQVI